MSDSVEFDVTTETAFVIQEITGVLSSPESRDLLFELGETLETGLEWDPDLKWDDSTLPLQKLVQVSVSAALCRAVILVIKADRKLSDTEVDFLRGSMAPILKPITQTLPGRGWPELIESSEDVFQLIRLLEESPAELFSGHGVGGRPSSVPKLCALCDPFVEQPLLPIFSFVVRRLCVAAADADGISEEEEKVILGFDELTDRGEAIAENVAAQLPEIATFESTANDNTTLDELRREASALGIQASAYGEELRRSNKLRKTISRRIRQNTSRNAEYIGEAWGLLTVWMIFACLLLACGVGVIVADFLSSVLLGIAAAVTSLGASINTVVKHMLNLSWHSTEALVKQRGVISRRRYKLWKELSNCDRTLKRLNELSMPLMKFEEERRSEKQRQQQESEVRRRAMAAYAPPSYGPIYVRGHFRKNGTYVQPHIRRR